MLLLVLTISCRAAQNPTISIQHMKAMCWSCQPEYQHDRLTDFQAERNHVNSIVHRSP